MRTKKRQATESLGRKQLLNIKMAKFISTFLNGKNRK